MIVCDESENMREIYGKLDKWNTWNRFRRRYILFFYFILAWKCSWNEIKEWNIAPFKPVLSVWFIQLSTYFYYLIEYKQKIYLF